DDAVALGVADGVGEDAGALLQPRGPLELAAEAGAVEHVVAEDEADGLAAHELAPEEEGVGEAAGLVLLGEGEAHPPRRAVAEEAAEGGERLRRRDDEDLADAREHQRAQ